MYSVLNASVLQIDDNNEVFDWCSEQLNICPVSPNRHPWVKDLVVNMRQETIAQREHEGLVKTEEFIQMHGTDTWRTFHALS